MVAYIELEYDDIYQLRSNNNTYILFKQEQVDSIINILLDIKHKNDEGLLKIDHDTIDCNCFHLRGYMKNCCEGSNYIYYNDIENILKALYREYNVSIDDEDLNKDKLKDKSLLELKIILARVDRKRKEKANEKTSCN